MVVVVEIVVLSVVVVSVIVVVVNEVVVMVVVVVLVVVVDVAVVVVVVEVQVHESHITGQCCRICFPAKLSKLQEASMYRSLRPHSFGSPTPLHALVVVEVVVVDVVATVRVVVELEPMQTPQVTGQSWGRPGNA